MPGFALRMENYLLCGIKGMSINSFTFLIIQTGGLTGVTLNYDQSLSSLKKTTTKLVKEKLDNAAGYKVGRMNYNNFDAAITKKHTIVVRGWPLKTFCSPANLTTLLHVKLLYNALTSGMAKFVKLNKAQYEDWMKDYQARPEVQERPKSKKKASRPAFDAPVPSLSLSSPSPPPSPTPRPPAAPSSTLTPTPVNDYPGLMAVTVSTSPFLPPINTTSAHLTPMPLPAPIPMPAASPPPSAPMATSLAPPPPAPVLQSCAGPAPLPPAHQNLGGGAMMMTLSFASGELVPTGRKVKPRPRPRKRGKENHSAESAPVS